MKRNTFMKTILLLFVSLFLFTACDITEPEPDCEKYSYGTVIVKNRTGYNLWVDVTWGNMWENYTKKISHGSSATYKEVPAGPVDIWGSLDNSYWSYESKYLSSCEELTFTWTLNKSAEKSADIEPQLVLEVSVNGEVIETIYDLKTKIK